MPVASSYCVPPAHSSGWALKWPTPLLSGHGATSGIIWQNPSDHSWSCRFPDLIESTWMMSPPARWSFTESWDWYDDSVSAYAVLSYELVDRTGAMKAILGAWFIGFNELSWQTSGITYGDDAADYVMNPWNVTDEYCGIQAKINCFWHDPGDNTWHRGAGPISDVTADLTDSRIMFARRDIWAPVKTFTSQLFTPGGGEGPYDFTSLFTAPLYTPPDFADVQRPWSRWELHCYSYTHGQVMDAMLASGSVGAGWLRQDNGIGNWAAWSGQFCYSPYPEFAAHGIVPPDRVYLYVLLI